MKQMLTLLTALLLAPLAAVQAAGAIAPPGDRNLPINQIYPPEAFYHHGKGGRVLDVTKPPFNAKGDGKTDDTQALCDAMRFVRDHYEDLAGEGYSYASYKFAQNWIIYLPNGEYLVSNTISQGWPARAYDIKKGWGDIKPELFDIEFEWDATRQGDFQLKVWDQELFSFNAKESTYEVHGRNGITIHSKWRISPVNGTIKVRLICDRSICSYFINDGYEAGNRYLAGFRPECNQALSLQGDGGTIFRTFQFRALRPTWKTAAR